MQTAKASRGLYKAIVPDCPYCHGRHEYSKNASGSRQADCGLGEYVLDFSDDKPTADKKADDKKAEI
jgi:hypothetical protein